MPACFQLIRKSDNQPAILQRVDEELCDYLGVELDTTLWHQNWYNVIGFMFAMDKYSWDEQVEYWHRGIEEPARSQEIAEHTERFQAIHSWLLENFKPNGWTQIGK